jgi:DNA-binding MarR family transcriptional regulator
MNEEDKDSPADSAPVSDASTRFINSDLAYALGRASDALYAGIAHEVAAAGLSTLEWKVLVVLHDLPRGWHVTGIAREVRANHSTIDKLVRRLAKEELVTIEPDDGDARRLRVKATAIGKRKIKRLMNAAASHEQALFAQLPAHITAQDFNATLKIITEYADDMARLVKPL